MMFSPNSEGLQGIITWWVPPENHNSKPQGVFWKMAGNLDKTLFFPSHLFCEDLVQAGTQEMGSELKVLIRMDWSEFKLIQFEPLPCISTHFIITLLG